MVYQEDLYISTKKRGFYDLTSLISKSVLNSNLDNGICHIFVNHTSASIVLCENIDKNVRSDLENFMSSLVRDGDPSYQHIAEGKDDMAAHIRTILTKSDLTIPIKANHLKLGRWQGIYLWEHRTSPQQRQISVTMIGDSKNT